MAQRTPPEPLEVDDVAVVAAGTVLWAVAFVVLLVLRETGTRVEGWWLQMCVCGAVLGLVGVRYCANRKRRLRR